MESRQIYNASQSKPFSLHHHLRISFKSTSAATGHLLWFFYSFDSIASSSLFELKSAGRLADDRIFELMVSSAQLEDIPPPPLSMNPKSLYKDIHFGILNHVISNKFDFSFAKWHRYYYAPLQNTVQNINILRNMNLPFFWVI